MIKTTATGWAIKVNGDIDVRTISPTARAAMVNYLVTNRIMGQSWAVVTTGCPDEYIQLTFESTIANVKLVQVTITEV